MVQGKHAKAQPIAHHNGFRLNSHDSLAFPLGTNPHGISTITLLYNIFFAVCYEIWANPIF